MIIVRRRIFILGSALSLTLCLATIVPQIRGEFLIGQAFSTPDGGGIRGIPVDLDWPPISKWHMFWNSFPFFPITVILILPPIFAIRSVEEVMKSRRCRRGRCPACGYDLRGNLSGACPECGTVIDQQAWRAADVPEMLALQRGHMTHRVTAVFENGVFRPLGPVSIDEGEHVELAFESSTPTPDSQTLANALDEIASLPLETEDCFDPADADRILYGGEDAR